MKSRLAGEQQPEQQPGVARVRAPYRLGVIAILISCGVSACGGGGNGKSTALESQRFARPTGALQCGESRLSPGERQRAQGLLEAAGVRVQAMGCGQDGRVRITVCGAESGELLVADVWPSASGAGATAELAARMLALGYQPWAVWPDARTQGCAGG